jgi:hypothetical protein
MNKFGASLTDDARVIIYNRLMFIVQATDDTKFKIYLPCLTKIGLYHTLDGVTNTKLSPFQTNIIFYKEKKALAFNQDKVVPSTTLFTSDSLP